MAKKKSKKNNQKQVDVAPPPENTADSTTAPPATGKDASPEDLSKSVAPPLETTNEESQLSVPVAASQQPSEGVLERPSGDTAMGAGQTTNNTVTSSLENDDLGVRTTEPMKQANDSTVDGQSHDAVAETHSQPNVADVVEYHAEPSDVSCALPKSSVAADVTASPPSNDQLGPSPEPDNGEAQGDEMPATTAFRATAMTSQAVESDHAAIETPLNDGAQATSPNLATVNSIEPTAAGVETPAL